MKDTPPTRKPRIKLMPDMSSFGSCSFDPCAIDDPPEEKSIAKILLASLIYEPHFISHVSPLLDFVKSNRRRWVAISYIIREMNGTIQYGKEYKIAKQVGVSRMQLHRWINEANEILPGIISCPAKKGRTR